MDLGQKEHAGGSLNATQLVFPGIHHILARVLEGRAVSLLLLDLSWNYPSVSSDAESPEQGEKGFWGQRATQSIVRGSPGALPASTSPSMTKPCEGSEPV